MQKYRQEGFFCLTYVEPKNQSDQAGANDFHCLIWIFWVCWLWYNINLFSISVSIWSLSISTALTYGGAVSSKKSPARALQTIFDTFDQSQHLFHKLHKSSLRFSCIYTFLEINIIWQTYCFFLIFSIKMTLQKFTNFMFFPRIFYFFFIEGWLFYRICCFLQNLNMNQP